MMKYTVKQLADIAGVSIRTLHYYDEISLLKPSSVGDNGYRYYEEDAILMLQQILFFRELDLSLEEIKEIIGSKDFEVLTTLESHRKAMLAKVGRLNALITTIDKTIKHLKGQIEMSSKELFTGFSEEKQKEYEVEIKQKYGHTDAYKQSVQRWASYSDEKKQQIFAEAGQVYTDLVANMEKGYDSQVVQAIIARWEQNLHYFYDPTPEVLMGLAEMYNSHPDFIANFSKIHPQLPAFLQQAIEYYCVEVLIESEES
jgi:DNA-binding transcriptional MerR regulator